MKQRLAALLREKTRRNARERLIDYVRWTFPRFRENWHHPLICEWLQRLDRREVIDGFPQGLDRLMIFAPPRHTKSELVAVRRSAWSLGRDVNREPGDVDRDTRQFIVATYGDKLSGSLSAAARDTLMSPLSQQVFPVKFKTLSDHKWRLIRPPEIENNRDSLIAAGIMGSFTGEGATDITVDDPIKNKQEAYSKDKRQSVYDQYVTAVTSRKQPGASIVLMMTRWHEDDLAGRLLKLAQKDKEADQWMVIVLAATNDDGKSSYLWNTATGEKTFLPAYEALWPDWKSRKELNRERRNNGEVFWQAMFQQAPGIAMGNIFLREKFKTFDSIAMVDRLIQIYDTAYEEGQENDYSARLTMGFSQQLGAFPILEGWRGKVAFPKLVAEVYRGWDECFKKFGRYPERMLVERKVSGISLIQQIEANNLSGQWVNPEGGIQQVPIIPIFGMPKNVSKEVYYHGVSGYQNAGQVMVPYSASWVPDFLDEVCTVPMAPNDDWADCMSHGLVYFNRPLDGNEYEEVVVGGEEVTISPELDEFDGGW